MTTSAVWTFARATDSNWNVTVSGPDRPASAAALDGLSDAELVAACLAGRGEAFDLIVERHRRPMYQLCYRFVPNHEDASDLCQDVFLRAYRGLRGFKGDASLGTWLYRIGVNVCLNRVGTKTLPSEPLDSHEHLEAKSDSPADLVLRDEQVNRVRGAVAQLPRKQRAALILRIYHEMSHQEIAAT